MRKFTSKAYNLQGSIFSDNRPIAKNTATATLSILNKLDEIKSRSDMDSYTQKVNAKKFLQTSQGKFYESLSKGIEDLTQSGVDLENNLFSNQSRSLTPAQTVMLPQVLVALKDKAIDLRNPVSGVQVAELAQQGLIDASFKMMLNEIHSNDVLESIQANKEELELLGNIKSEFENEVDAIFPDLKNFTEV
ncbi:hypothetical protein SAMN06313540_11211 [Epsilonproteobacteria bacterium SCGC AD-308-E02]|jgi:hypothetical protein|nr:hypothetical protein SAMN06313540_11211 [Epsilonproteobacteria bacterium SCGC AD-308-E02]